MKKNNYKILALLLLFYSGIKAQNFNYQFSSSTSSYADISSPTYLAQSTTWNPSYKIPLGFSFKHMGQNFDSVQIFTNGYLVFDNNFNYAFAAFTFNVGNHTGGTGTNPSSISYQLSGGTGSHVLKIQFKNCGVVQQDSGVVNYQVWLYEGSNQIDVAIGNNTYSSTALSNNRKMFGPINMNPLKPGQTGYIIHGSPTSPSVGTASSVNTTCTNSSLTGFPSANTVYTFLPF